MVFWLMFSFSYLPSFRSVSRAFHVFVLTEICRLAYVCGLGMWQIFIKLPCVLKNKYYHTLHIHQAPCTTQIFSTLPDMLASLISLLSNYWKTEAQIFYQENGFQVAFESHALTYYISAQKPAKILLWNETHQEVLNYCSYSSMWFSSHSVVSKVVLLQARWRV